MDYTIQTITDTIGLIRLYWKNKFPSDNLYAVRLFQKYNEISVRNQNPFTYLLKLYEQFPDAPDILMWLGQEYQKDHEYLKALQMFSKLIELYPNIDHYKKEFNSCKVFMESNSMPDTQETLDWLQNRLIEIWKP